MTSGRAREVDWCSRVATESGLVCTLYCYGPSPLEVAGKDAGTPVCDIFILSRIGVLSGRVVRSTWYCVYIVILCTVGVPRRCIESCKYRCKCQQPVRVHSSLSERSQHLNELRTRHLAKKKSTKLQNPG